MSSVQTFACPNCGGQIPFSGTTDKSVTCPFCDSTVVVPKELRATAVQPRVIITGTPQEQVLSPDMVKKGAIGIAGFTIASFVLPLIIACVIMAVVAGAIFFVVNSTTSAINQAVSGSGSSAPSSGSVSGLFSSFASVTMKFGSKGTGPGQFDDIRHIGVDANGNLYVGQYIGGRIQVFDPSGKYQTEWAVDRKAPLTGFAVSRKGAVYTAQGGEIQQHNGQTGEVVGSLNYKAGNYFDDLWLMPNDTLITAWYDNSDDIVVFNPQGKVAQTIQAAISTVTSDSELDTHVAGDGAGNIYALGTFNNAVFKFSPAGKFLNQFGSEGDKPGQLQAPLAIAVDGQGRVFVSDIKGVQVFGSDGQYQTLINVDGPAYGLAVDGAGNLWVAAGTQVFKYALSSSQ